MLLEHLDQIVAIDQCDGLIFGKLAAVPSKMTWYHEDALYRPFGLIAPPRANGQLAILARVMGEFKHRRGRQLGSGLGAAGPANARGLTVSVPAGTCESGAIGAMGVRQRAACPTGYGLLGGPQGRPRNPRDQQVVPLRGTHRVRESGSAGCAALHPRLFTGDRYAVSRAWDAIGWSWHAVGWSVNVGCAAGSGSAGCAAFHLRLFTGDRYAVSRA